MSRMHILILLVTILSLQGCGPPNVDISEGARKLTPSDYEHIMGIWTREESVYTLDTMDNVLTVTATYHSWEFRWAYSVRYSDDHRLSPDERAEVRANEFAEYRNFHEFTVATTSGDMKWSELGEDSVWRVSLSNDRGDEVLPQNIEEIRKPTPSQVAYFPYIGPFRNAYRINFPRVLPGTEVPVIGPDNEYFCLNFAGSLGNGRLCWNI